MTTKQKIKPYKEVAATAKGRLDDIWQTISRHSVVLKTPRLSFTLPRTRCCCSTCNKALKTPGKTAFWREELAGLKTDPAANHDAIVRIEEDPVRAVSCRAGPKAG